MSRLTHIFLVRKDMVLDCAFTTQKDADNYCFERNAAQRQEQRGSGSTSPWIYFHWDKIELKRPR